MTFKHLIGKRLLVLGSKPLLAEIVEKAQSMGVVVGVTDYNPYEKAPAKQIADEYYDISLSDTDAVAALVKEKHFDGVLTGFTDSYLFYYLEICEKAEVPCYGGTHQFKIATDKTAFKEACIKAGLPVIPGGNATTYDECVSVAEGIGYPLMLKPADNSGSRGVIKCEAPEDLQECFDYAHSFSPTGLVIIEKYMDCDNVATGYYVCDGEAKLGATCERGLHVADETNSSITSFTVYPSRYTARYVVEVEANVQAFLRDNGFSNGPVALQAFVDKESFYFCEMCFRPSGGHHHLLVEDQCGEDQLGLLIEYALTGEYRNLNRCEVSPDYVTTCAMVKILGLAGETVGSVSGFDELGSRPEIIKAQQSVSIGSEVGVDGTTAQVVAVLWYRLKPGEDPLEPAKRYLRNLDIRNENGKRITFVSVTRYGGDNGDEKTTDREYAK